ncbi:MAG: hypothetical protein U0414_24470 [Polyangiaceae bacterium]
MTTPVDRALTSARRDERAWSSAGYDFRLAAGSIASPYRGGPTGEGGAVFTAEMSARRALRRTATSLAVLAVGVLASALAGWWMRSGSAKLACFGVVGALASFIGGLVLAFGSVVQILAVWARRSTPLVTCEAGVLRLPSGAFESSAVTSVRAVRMESAKGERPRARVVAHVNDHVIVVLDGFEREREAEEAVDAIELALRGPAPRALSVREPSAPA